MISPTLRFLLVAGVSLGAAACGSSGSSSTSAAAPSTSTTSVQVSGASTASASSSTLSTSTTSAAQAPSSTTAAASPIATRTIAAGTVLTSAQGLTLYYFTPEKGTHVACTGGCARTWPPLLVTTAGALSLPAGVSGTLATVRRPDGTMQVTYNSWPLYRFASDSAPGSAGGEGIGGVWFVAKPGLAP